MNDDIFERFPDMQPISSPPSLFGIYGIGTSIAGKRDVDEETDTYVKTHCLTLLFIPLIAIGAYRVADAQTGGWYFIGKVPLSKFTKLWNVAFLVAILAVAGGGGWYQYTNTPTYLATAKLADADALAAEGKTGQAAKLYLEVARGKALQSQAKTKFNGLFTTPPADGTEAADLYRVAMNLHREQNSLIPDLFTRGMAYVHEHLISDPKAALGVLEIIAPLATKPDEILSLRIQLLEKLQAADPSDLDVASKLAVVYEAKGKLDLCEKLLVPLEGKLGTRDAAATLGRIYSRKGDFDKAIGLLKPYVDAKLPALRAADSRIKAAYAAVNTRMQTDFDNNQVPGFDYNAYRAASKEVQSAMIDVVFSRMVKEDAGIRDALNDSADTGGVVSAALDLGIARLQRGQKFADPDARKKELEEAEKTLLSIRTFAGQDDDYKLSLGQVYYWLGKSIEGKKEFDELLAVRNRSPEILLTVGMMLREVGVVSEARKMIEEAYNASPEPEKKFRAARSRSVMSLDNDDQILWLSKSDPNDLETQASLAYARAVKATLEGRDGEAITQYQLSISIFERMPVSTGSLNNSALSHLEIARLTSDKAEFAKGVDKLERAIALRPTDSILIHNTANTVLDGAIRDVVGTAIDFQVLKRGGSWDVFAYLHNDRAGKQKSIDAIRQHPGFVKSKSYYEKLLILSPKSNGGYANLQSVYNFTRDTDGMTALAEKLERIDLDLVQEMQSYRDAISGKNDAKTLEDFNKGSSRVRETLEAARAKKGPTYAIAVNAYILMKMGAYALGQIVDADELVKLADEAYALAPSEGASGTQYLALGLRAHIALIKESPEYAAFAKKYHRTLSTYAMNIVLAEGGPLAAKVATNPDVKRYREMTVASANAHPDEMSVGTWAVLKDSHPAIAAKAAERVKSDSLELANHTIARKFSPLLATAAIQTAWRLRIAGKDAEARALLEKLNADGIPVPVGK